MCVYECVHAHRYMCLYVCMCMYIQISNIQISKTLPTSTQPSDHCPPSSQKEGISKVQGSDSGVFQFYLEYLEYS
jgi:hypothetical protein